MYWEWCRIQAKVHLHQTLSQLANRLIAQVGRRRSLTQDREAQPGLGFLIRISYLISPCSPGKAPHSQTLDLILKSLSAVLSEPGWRESFASLRTTPGACSIPSLGEAVWEKCFPDKFTLVAARGADCVCNRVFCLGLQTNVSPVGFHRVLH